MRNAVECQKEHDIDRSSIMESDSDNERVLQLKHLFRHQVQTTKAGCRDSIDSILSKYGSLRAEVQYDPRIGLVLGTEFDESLRLETSISPHRPPAQLFVDQYEHRDSSDRDHRPSKVWQPEDDANDGHVLRYIGCPQETTPTTYVEDDDSDVEDFASASSNSDIRHTDATSVIWDDLEDTLLGTYAKIDDDQVKHPGGTLYALDKPLQSSRTTSQTQLLNRTNLDFSPIVMTVVIKPVVVNPISNPDNGNDGDAVAHVHYDLENAQILINTIKMGDTKSYKVAGIQDSNEAASNSEPSVNVRINSDDYRRVGGSLVQQLSQSQPVAVHAESNQQLSDTVPRPSHPGWLEQDGPTDGVLNFLIILILVAVALAGRVFC